MDRKVSNGRIIGMVMLVWKVFVEGGYEFVSMLVVIVVEILILFD